MPIVDGERADLIDRAIAWHLRLADASADEWADFVTWLEADAAHAAAYDRIAAQDRALTAEQFPAPPNLADNDNDAVAAPARRRGWLFAGGMAAAALAVVVGINRMPASADPYVVATLAGERRSVTLADGTRIDLSGATRVRLDRAAPRFAALESGEALVHVTHDPAAPFTVTAAGRTVQDIGTIFDLSSVDGRFAVSVAEGAVVYDPAGAAVRLNPGDRLSAVAGAATVARSAVAPADVGGWRRGMLDFNAEPLHAVAATLERHYGFRITMSPGLSQRPFTGMVRFSGAADRDVPHLAELIGATWRRDEGRWVLGEVAAR